jgi:intein/homing endonuclease
VKSANTLVNIKAGGQSILTTPDHPFLINSKWVEAKNILVGDSLLLIDGRKVSVNYKSIRDTFAVVYNFGVDEFHSYYITELGILTHITGCGELFKKGTVKVFSNSVAEERLASIIENLGFKGQAKYNQALKDLKGGGEFIMKDAQQAKKLLEEAGVTVYREENDVLRAGGSANGHFGHHINYQTGSGVKDTITINK